jgi:type I restriction enzyme, R subunit
MGFSEADTRSKLIDPKLVEAGWDESRITREHPVTDGKILDSKGTRNSKRFADYVLYHGGMIIAIVEAKDEDKDPLVGMPQAKDYCKMTNTMFAYSSNGHKIEEFDFTTNEPRTVEKFPTPEELFQRLVEGRFGKLEHDPLTQEYHQGKFAPRYYQDAAIKNIFEAYLKGQKNILITMATGTGKTKVAFQTVWKLYKAGSIKRALFVTDRNFLVSNAVGEFEPFFNDGDADVWGTKDSSMNKDIHISTYQTLFAGEDGNREYEKFPENYFDFIIIDECHRSGFGSWNAILKRFKNATVLGMTATPKRNDNINTYEYFGDPVYSYSLGQGIDDGFLAPYKINKIYTNIDKDGGLSVKQAIEQGAQVHAPEGSEVKEWYRVSTLWRSLILPDRTEVISKHLAELLYTYGPMEKTMIFCVTQDHARLVTKHLQKSFSHLGFDNYAVTITSEETGIEKDYIDFQDSEKKTPVVATTVDLLSTGVDCPSVKNIVLLKPISSKIVFKQIIGRGARVDKLTGKYEFRIIDYTNATRLFDEWDKPEDPKVVESKGERKYFLKGTIMDKETGSAITNARIVIPLGTNEEVAVKTNNFGKFRFENLPSAIKLTASAPEYSSLTIDTMAQKKDSVEILIELETKPDKSDPVIIDGLPVWIAEETTIELNDGRNVTKAQYTEYSKEEIRKRVIDLNDLKRIWINQRKREVFITELVENSVKPKVLASIFDASEADPFDLLSHITFGSPLITRDERSDWFMNNKEKFIKSFGESGKQIILDLLEKYREDGIDNVMDSKVFDLPPFDKMGHVVGVADKVGGIENLKKIIMQIESGLYQNE